MRKFLLLLVVTCCSFIYANGQTVNASFYTSYGFYGTVNGGGTPAYIKPNCTMDITAQISNAVKYEWTLRSSAPEGSSILQKDGNHAKVKVGSMNSSKWLVLDFEATDSAGFITYGFYYFYLQQ